MFLELLHRYDVKGKTGGKCRVWTYSSRKNPTTGTNAVDIVGIFLLEQGYSPDICRAIDSRANKLLGLTYKQIRGDFKGGGLGTIYREIDRELSTNQSIIAATETVFARHPVEGLDLV